MNIMFQLATTIGILVAQLINYAVRVSAEECRGVQAARVAALELPA